MQVGTMDEIELSDKGRSLKLRPVNDRWIELSASERAGWLPLGAESPEYVVARLISLLTGELAVESGDPTWVMSLSEGVCMSTARSHPPTALARCGGKLGPRSGVRPNGPGSVDVARPTVCARIAKAMSPRLAPRRAAPLRGEPGLSEPDWPFSDPPNTASITLRRILREGRPIRLVTHDVEDGSWQFLDGEEITEEDALVVGLDTVLAHDPSVAAVADLPLGGRAWRDSPGADWSKLA